MFAVAFDFGLSAGFLAVFAAVRTELSAVSHRTLAHGMRAFFHVSH
jgi:hypothetical protein